MHRDNPDPQPDPQPDSQPALNHAERAKQPRPKLGVVATDALRLIGLQTLLKDGIEFDIVPLSVPHALDCADFEVVILDAGTTDHLFELLAIFHRLRPQTRLLVLGAEKDHGYIQQVIGAGAKGYLSYGVESEELRLAIAVVRDGSVWAPRKVMAQLLESSSQRQGRDTSSIPRPTRRELEVLRLLVLGQPNREIASALGVDEGTVKAHVGRLMRKVGVRNRTALTMEAIHKGWC